MHITCETATLVQGVAAVERAVSSSETQPILTGILIEAMEGKVLLSATDREIGIKSSIAADVQVEGACVLDGRLLSAMVRRLSAEQTTLQLEPNNQIVIRSGSARLAVPTRDAADFPRIPEVADGDSCSLLQSEMRRLIRQTSFAVSHEESRPYLTGILMELDGHQIRMVATDASRLALRKGALVDPFPGSTKAIIPAKSLSELARLLQGGPEDQLRITVSDNEVVFSLPGTTFLTRVIDGQFPDYKRVFPPSYHTKFTTDRRQLLAAVERAALLARKGTPTVRMQVADQNLVLSAMEAEVGELREDLPIVQEGDSLEKAYQSRFWADVLRVIEEDKVVVEMGDGLLPAVVYGEGDEAYRYVVMPVRVG